MTSVTALSCLIGWLPYADATSRWCLAPSWKGVASVDTFFWASGSACSIFGHLSVRWVSLRAHRTSIDAAFPIWMSQSSSFTRCLRRFTSRIAYFTLLSGSKRQVAFILGIQPLLTNMTGNPCSEKVAVSFIMDGLRANVAQADVFTPDLSEEAVKVAFNAKCRFQVTKPGRSKNWGPSTGHSLWPPVMQKDFQAAAAHMHRRCCVYVEPYIWD